VEPDSSEPGGAKVLLMKLEAPFTEENYEMLLDK
jgi:hypothetical protein